MLPTFAGAEASRPWPPVNMLADFAGGGLSAAFGIVSAIHARTHNGKFDHGRSENIRNLSSNVSFLN